MCLSYFCTRKIRFQCSVTEKNVLTHASDVVVSPLAWFISAISDHNILTSRNPKPILYPPTSVGWMNPIPRLVKNECTGVLIKNAWASHSYTSRCWELSFFGIFSVFLDRSTHALTQNFHMPGPKRQRVKGGGEWHPFLGKWNFSL